jgi:hypothetical protein
MPDDAEVPFEDTDGVGEYWQNPMAEPVLETVVALGVCGTGLYEPAAPLGESSYPSIGNGASPVTLSVAE